ncbi:uncharacterized protein LOC127102208 [Lathyrus oleraceus]|uniref:uncharacterized protein LOC127102208 n=1 Tax=Pisum sativum TaxID=3888 RepID=UPI0021D2916E|nr:uncharacterized protein LOC127102208 [Pisum sativum]
MEVEKLRVTNKQQKAYLVLYSGWLSCRSRHIAPYLPKRIMRQFDYTQTIPRHLVVYTLPVLTCIQINDMFDDYKSHMVLEKAQSTIAESDRSYVEGYIKWFFRVSRLYMVQAAPRDPSRPTHHETL